MEIEELWGLIALGKDAPRDYTDWAEHRMAQEESDTLVILASLGLDKEPIREDVVHYFHRYLNERLITPPTKEESLSRYVNHLCRQTIDKALDPDCAVLLLADLHRNTGFEGGWDNPWSQLSYDLTLLDMGEKVRFFHPELKQSNRNDYIMSFASSYLSLRTVSVC